MTRIYGEDGTIIPVTVIEAGPCPVLQVKTQDADGYEAVQVGFEDKPRRLASKPERGHVAAISSKRSKARSEAGVEAPPKADCEPQRYVREFRTDGEDHGCEVGQVLDVGVFEEATHVDVVGTSKGRGFAGVMKRHNFSGQGASHGVKRVHRHGGSIGMSADPARVLKGTRMGGQYGNKRSTVRHLKLVKVDKDNNLLLVKGAVPGPNGGFLYIRETNRVG